MSRTTIQQTIIEQTLRRLGNHPTAEEVYDAVKAEYPSIGRATVFRVLGKLSDDGIVKRVRINNGADHFDHQTFEHHHVRCTACGRVDDVKVVLTRTIDDEAEQSSGYRILGHELQFDGICPACQAKQAITA